MIIVAVLLIMIFQLLASRVYAIYDPLSVPNNKFGIHVADPNDIPRVGKLVNSTGGNWGYVTLVIADHERNFAIWDSFFRQMRRERLIPIVRLATHVEGNSWTKPSLQDAQSWASFLNGLPWPTKNRYVVLFNEPNHAKEWGGEVSPGQYADILVVYARALKQASEDFFVLPAGFDASAPNGPDTMDEELFLRWMWAKEPYLAESIDGWTSHSYPNPGFSGSPFAKGRGTVRTFEWELTLLAQLGINKKLPVFITETGWANDPNISTQSRLTSSDISTYLEVAAQTVWNNPGVVAVTPFLFNYQEPLFAMFSWLLPGTQSPQPFFLTYQRLPKTRGYPLLAPSEAYLSLLGTPLIF